MALALVLAVVLPGCPAPLRRVEVVSPLRGGSLPVHVVNQPVSASHRDTTWRNECQAIPRLSADEPRGAWLRRIVAYVEQRPNRLTSITYPPGGTLEEALVCFSVEMPVVPRASAPSGPELENERPPR